jgi:MFS family permease
MKSQNHVLSYALIASLGGLLFGFDTAVISGTTHWLSEVFDLSSFWLGFTVASALIGTIIGSLHVGKPADRFGRKRMLIVIAALYFISALGSALAWNWTVSVISRGRTTESETVLQRCGVLSAKVGDEIAAIQDSFRSDDQSPKTVFFSKAHSRHIFLAIAVTF